MSFRDSKNLIIHDYFENFGGGERLVKVLYENKSFDIIYGFEKNNLTKVVQLFVGRVFLFSLIPVDSNRQPTATNGDQRGPLG